MKETQLVENYSIEGIAQSIVKDHPVSQKYTDDDKKRMYRECQEKLEAFPNLKALLSLDHIHSYGNTFASYMERLVIIPPEIVVVDSRIQDMCALPYWSYYGTEGEGTFGPCGGIEAFSCCPPFSLKADKVQAKLDNADLFLVMQTQARNFGAGEPGDQGKTINKLVREITGVLGKDSVVQKFGGGPCMVCSPEPCECEGKCRAPENKIPALESLGVCVDQVCKDCALLTGDNTWPITWIKGYGGPNQSPMQCKTTVALAIKL